MWRVRGVLLGTSLGVAAAVAVLLASFVLGPPRRGWAPDVGRLVSVGPTIALIGSAVAAPGALLLSVPLLGFLRRQQEKGRTRGNLLVLAAAAGAALGLVNLLGVLLCVDGSDAVGELLTDNKDGPLFLLAAAVGGLGLGLGCVWGLPRKEAA
jgi:hypothetical protein